MEYFEAIKNQELDRKKSKSNKKNIIPLWRGRRGRNRKKHRIYQAKKIKIEQASIYPPLEGAKGEE